MRRSLRRAARLGLVTLFCLAGCGQGYDPAPPPEGVDGRNLNGLKGLWGVQGRRAREFVRPRGIAITPSGEVYCVDMTGRVQCFDQHGEFRASWMMPEIKIGLPEGLAVTADGLLLVADTHYSRVICFRPNGEIAFMFGREGAGPGEFMYPLGVAVDREGNIYVTEYGAQRDRVQKFTADGRYITGWGGFGREPGKFRRPSGVACDSAGNVYVADAVNHRVQKFDGDGRLLAILGRGRDDRPDDAPGTLRYPFDVAVGPDDSVYVLEYGNHRVQRFSPAGRARGFWGGPGGGAGQFFDPWCIALNARGECYVTDTGNHRIQHFVMQPEVFVARKQQVEAEPPPAAD